MAKGQKPASSSTSRPLLTVRHGLVVVDAPGPSRWLNRLWHSDEVFDRPLVAGDDPPAKKDPVSPAELTRLPSL